MCTDRTIRQEQPTRDLFGAVSRVASASTWCAWQRCADVDGSLPAGLRATMPSTTTLVGPIQWTSSTRTISGQCVAPARRRSSTAFASIRRLTGCREARPSGVSSALLNSGRSSLPAQPARMRRRPTRDAWATGTGPLFTTRSASAPPATTPLSTTRHPSRPGTNRTWLGQAHRRHTVLVDAPGVQTHRPRPVSAARTVEDLGGTVGQR